MQEILPNTYSSTMHIYMHSHMLGLKIFDQEA